MNMITRSGRDAGEYGKRRPFNGSPLFFACILVVSLSSKGQQGPLQDSVRKISADAQATVGVALLVNQAPGVSRAAGVPQMAAIPRAAAVRFAFNGNGHFPMQSVYKFPLGLYILDQVDKGRLSLDQKITIRKGDWEMQTYSPLRDKYQEADADITVREILSYTVSLSDNNGCDLLFRLAGGPGKVNDFIHSLGIKDIAITATEAEMHAAWDVQYRNWCTPVAMVALLKGFDSGKYLSPAGDSLMLQLMIAGAARIPRIGALLPHGTVVARKAGTSDTNAAGITAATNDVGIITLPRDRHLLIVVFVRDSKADMATREGVIARIARAAYDAYTPNASRK
jgi:beta-lactamase class A